LAALIFAEQRVERDNSLAEGARRQRTRGVLSGNEGALRYRTRVDGAAGLGRIERVRRSPLCAGPSAEGDRRHRSAPGEVVGDEEVTCRTLGRDQIGGTVGGGAVAELLV